MRRGRVLLEVSTSLMEGQLALEGSLGSPLSPLCPGLSNAVHHQSAALTVGAIRTTPQYLTMTEVFFCDEKVIVSVRIVAHLGANKRI
jgi:hypothetical protein